MNEEQIRKQSEAAYGQWAEQWRKQAKENSIFEMKSLDDFENSGIGKAVLCVANGYSFEENIESIKKYKDNVDILCCDKTLGHLLDNDIVPKFCMVCDANVNYEKYMEKWKDKLQDTILFINVCGNPLWAKLGNWKDKYFFINKDILNSHLEFSKISGCENFIAAGTNVSNAMVILLTQCDNENRRNFFAYDKILLIGYDYSWRVFGKYYSFDEIGGGKTYYMRHNHCMTKSHEFAYTSGNLAFSAQWFETYVRTFDLPVINCTKHTILTAIRDAKIDEQLKYRYKPEDSEFVRKTVSELKILNKKTKQLKEAINKISKDHTRSFACSI